MILLWLKRHTTIIITASVCFGFVIYCYGCEPKTASLSNNGRRINRQELQLELDQFIGLAELRMVDLDKQDELRAIILQNALILVQGQPFNPLGILTGVATIYGIMQGSSNVTRTVKNARNKRKIING